MKPDIRKGNGPEKNLEILFLSEGSRKIVQALSNANSIKILQLLETRNMSAGEIAEKLSLGLNALKYNLDSLLEVDLIRVSGTKWSQRGRKINIYEPVEKIILLIPGCKDINGGEAVELKEMLELLNVSERG